MVNLLGALRCIFAGRARSVGASTYMVKHKEIRSKAGRKVVADSSLLPAQKVCHGGEVVCVS